MDRFSGVIAAWALVLTMGAASLVIIPALQHGSGSSQLVGVHIIAGGAAPLHQVTPPCGDASAQSPGRKRKHIPLGMRTIASVETLASPRDSLLQILPG